MKRDPADLVRQLYAAGSADAVVQAGPRWWFAFRGQECVAITQSLDGLTAWQGVPNHHWRQYSLTARRVLCAIALRAARRQLRVMRAGGEMR